MIGRRDNFGFGVTTLSRKAPFSWNLGLKPGLEISARVSTKCECWLFASE